MYSPDDERDRRTAERLRIRAGLTPRQWTIAVSVLLFLPYPLFVYALAYTAIDVTLVGLVSIGYSILAMAIHFAS